MITIVTAEDIGTGLEISGGKVNVAVDNSTITVENGKLKALSTTIVQPINTVKSIDGLEVFGESLRLRMTANLPDGSTGTGSVNLPLADVINAIKGEPVQNLSGQTIGYLLPV